MVLCCKIIPQFDLFGSNFFVFGRIGEGGDKNGSISHQCADRIVRLGDRYVCRNHRRQQGDGIPHQNAGNEGGKTQSPHRADVRR